MANITEITSPAKRVPLNSNFTNLNNETTANTAEIIAARGLSASLNERITSEVDALEFEDASLQAQVDAIVIGGTEVDPRVSQALVDGYNTTWTTLKGRLDNSDTRIDVIESDIATSESTTLTNTSSIWSTGTGKNDVGTDIDVTSSVREGQVSDVVVGGMTVYQIEPNGRALCNDISKFNHSFFSPVPTQNTDHIDVEISTGNTSSVFGWDSDTYINPLDYLFIKVDVDFISGTSFSIDWAGVTKVVTSKGRQIVYLKRQASSDLSVNNDWISLRSNGNSGDKFKIYKISQYKITAEEYAFPESELNTRYGFHSTGTKSTVSAERLRSVGKNLLIEPKTATDFDFKVTVSISSDAEKIVLTATGIYSRTLKNMQLKPNTSYTVSIDGFGNDTRTVSVVGSNYPDSSGETAPLGFVILGTVRSVKTFSFTTPSDGKVMFKYYVTNANTTGSITIYSAQIEQNTVATPYEPCVSSEAFIPNVGELRSVPNGTKDEVSVIDGVATHKKNVSDDVVIPTIGWSIHRSLTNTTSFKIDLGITDGKLYIISETANIRSTLPFSVKPWNNIYSYDEEGMSFNYDVAIGILYVRILNTKLTTIDVAGFQTWLQNNYPSESLTYQLATPIVTDIDVDGQLISYPNGTIYVDPYHKKSHLYGTGLTFDYALTEIEKVVDINGDEVDLSTVTLAVDGLSATITSATATDTYTVYGLIDTSLSTIPETTMTLNTNTKSILESAVGTIKLLGDKVKDLKEQINMIILGL